MAISALEHATPDMIGTGGATGAGATAILAEIAALLERVAAGGEAVQIDLCGPTCSPQIRAKLLQALGPGEVLIRLKADGESTIRETSVQGVWWNEHTDRYGNLLAAFLEVARVPAILPVDSEQLRRGAERLRADLQTVSKTVD
ncbi:MAG: hydrogenase expression/formation C-terminal domain-containing protein [Steroidobacteraceae bacterium]